VKTIRMNEYHKDTLANGLRLVTVEMPHLHSVEMTCHIGVGSRYEQPAEAGISHFLEHMLFRGCRDFPNGATLEAAFEAIGGTVNAATDAETTCYHSRLHPDHLAEGAALFAALLRRPLFNDLDIERRIILEEALEDFNEAGKQINPDNLTSALLWPDHPLSLSTVGTREALPTLTVQDLTRHHAIYYTPANCVLALAGRITRRQALDAVEKAFSDWQGKGSPAPLPAPPLCASPTRTVWVRDAASQVHLQLAFRVPGWHDGRMSALRLLRRLLSGGGTSRLMLRLREQLGLTYHVEANLGLYDDCGVFTIDLAVAPASLVTAMQEVLNILTEVCDAAADGDELQRARRGFLYELEFSRDQADSRANRFGWGELVGYPLSLEDERRQLLALSAAQVRETAATLLRPENLAVALVGPFRNRDRTPVEGLLRDFRK